MTHLAIVTADEESAGCGVVFVDCFHSWHEPRDLDVVVTMLQQSVKVSQVHFYLTVSVTM